jgi:PTS system cellobiose-specific IIA component
MDMSLSETAMSLIADAGDAKSYALESIGYARERDFTSAKESLNNAKEAMVRAHETQTDLLRKEMSGQGENVSLLMAHAQDHMMASVLMRELAEEFIILYENLNDLKRKEASA